MNINRELSRIFTKMKDFDELREVSSINITLKTIHYYYLILERLCIIQNTYNSENIFFKDNGKTILNPFYDLTGREICNPIVEYDNLYLNSIFFDIFKELVSENNLGKDFKIHTLKVYFKYQDLLINLISFQNNISINEMIKKQKKENIILYIKKNENYSINPFNDGYSNNKILSIFRNNLLN